MNIAFEIAKRVKEKGGNTYYVGGFVRDKLLGINNKDIDIEVHGISPNDLKEILSEFGQVLEYGKDFGIYSLAGQSIDIALPRKEKNTGKGHRDFDVYVDPYIGTYKASKRRDFTINSFMQDVITGEIIDHFNGQEDLKNKVLRHVDSNTFAEDPLRVFRAAQFASRFDFEVAKETIAICKTIDVSTLSKERVEEELRKAFIKSNKPSIFFNVLKDTNKLNYWFKEINDSNSYIETMNILDESWKYKDKVSDLYSFRWLCLTCKLEISKAKELIRRITNRNDLYSYLIDMIVSLEKPNLAYKENIDILSTNIMFDSVKYPADLIYFSKCTKTKDDKKDKFLQERFNIYKETLKQDYVKGEDLIKAGISPSEDFKDALVYANKLRLKGIKKEEALNKVLEYIKTSQNK